MTSDNFCFYSQNRLIQTSHQEVNGTVILPPLVFPGLTFHDTQHNDTQYDDIQQNDTQLNNKATLIIKVRNTDCRKLDQYAVCRYTECPCTNGVLDIFNWLNICL